MSLIPIRPDVPFGPPSERSDAARNRERLLDAARELVAEIGAEALTMDALACKAGVGKGTVFRRFGSRAGLMMTLLSDAESSFQQRFIFGPPPLGPGAPPLERLIAYGEGRIYFVLQYGELLKAAGVSAQNRFDAPPAVLSRRHVELLLVNAGMREDPAVMAGSLCAVLDVERIVHDVRVHGISPKRLVESWRHLVTSFVNQA